MTIAQGTDVHPPDAGAVLPDLAGTNPDPADLSALLLVLSDDRDKQLHRLLEAERAAYAAGYADGRSDERIEADQAWAARPAQRTRQGDALADALADVEARRWELRGEQRTRDTFGRPHPADYTGKRQESAA